MNSVKYSFLLATLLLASCSDSIHLNCLDSDNYTSKIERVKTLKNEIIYNSNFNNAEFELFNVNGFSNSRTRAVGASSWDYKFVVKVDSSDIDKWTKGMIKTEPINTDFVWTKKCIKERTNEWSTNSKPEFYFRKGDDVILIVYRAEGIIYKRIVNP